jgi:hypothetical protein
MWIQEREDVPAHVKRMISLKMMMLSAYFSPTGFVSIEFPPEAQKYKSQFLMQTILSSRIACLSVRRPERKPTAAHLHLDNARPHNSRLVIEKMEEYGFIRVPQPSYSPDLAACDCFLFG